MTGIHLEPTDPRPPRKARSWRTYKVCVPPPDGHGPAVTLLTTQRAQEAFTKALEVRGWIEGYDGGDGFAMRSLRTIWPLHLEDADPSWPWWVLLRWRRREHEEAA